MSNDMAIRSAALVPSGYVQMETVKCPTCSVVFKIIHVDVFKDPAKIEDQTAMMRETLSGDHVDPKFQNHLDEYELD